MLCLSSVQDWMKFFKLCTKHLVLWNEKYVIAKLYNLKQKNVKFVRFNFSGQKCQGGLYWVWKSWTSCYLACIDIAGTLITDAFPHKCFLAAESSSIPGESSLPFPGSYKFFLQCIQLCCSHLQLNCLNKSNWARNPARYAVFFLLNKHNKTKQFQTSIYNQFLLQLALQTSSTSNGQ